MADLVHVFEYLFQFSGSVIAQACLWILKGSQKGTASLLCGRAEKSLLMARPQAGRCDSESDTSSKPVCKGSTSLSIERGGGGGGGRSTCVASSGLEKVIRSMMYCMWSFGLVISSRCRTSSNILSIPCFSCVFVITNPQIVSFRGAESGTTWYELAVKHLPACGFRVHCRLCSSPDLQAAISVWT